MLDTTNATPALVVRKIALLAVMLTYAGSLAYSPPAAAQAELCGNGTIDFAAGETCDDGGICRGGTNDGQACTTVEPTACPEGTCTPDDGDLDFDDTCPVNCAINRTCAPSGTLEVTVRYAQTCLGDCNANGRVELNELITGVGIGLGTNAIESCPNFDLDEDGLVSIDSLVAGVGGSINGCPIDPLGTGRFFLRYPDAAVRLPGSGSSSDVVDRISVPFVGSVTPNDIDYALRVLPVPDFGFVIDPDELFTVSFDLCEGAGELTAEDFRCTVFDAFSPEGPEVTAQTSCFVELP